MTAIPERINTTAQLIDKAIKAQHNEKPRHHLGASLIGHHCERWLWYSFRWVITEDFNGRMLRLFRRGQNEEETVVSDLRLAGLRVKEIDNETGLQFRISDGHFGGSLDGIVLAGVPEAPNKKHVLEIKTHSKKSFDDLVKNGVQKSKPQHYAQMQVYMHKTNIDRALYVSVCKDNDTYYTERVRHDASFAEKLLDKAQRIIATDRPPEPIAKDATWWQCKFCAAKDICHHGKTEQINVNCRTCANFTAKRNGESYCERWQAPIPQNNQYDGCPSHIINPHLVPWQFKGEHPDKPWHIIFDNGNGHIVNGETEYKSSELLAGISFAQKPLTQQIREELGAEIVQDTNAKCIKMCQEKNGQVCECQDYQKDCWDIPF